MRQVYFDPFGSYVAGLDKGIERQSLLEQRARENRSTDWNYFNIDPLKLETARRENAYQAWGEPLRRQVAQANAEQAVRGSTAGELDFQQKYGAPFGITQPYFDAYGRYSGINMQPTGVPNQFNYVDSQGRIVGTQNNPGQTMLDYWNYDKARTEANQLWKQQYDTAGQQLDTDKFMLDAYYKPYFLQAQQGQNGARSGTMPYFGDNWTPSWAPGANNPTQPTQPTQPSQAAPNGMPDWMRNLQRQFY